MAQPPPEATILSVAEMIDVAFGDPEVNIVHHKLIQTILYLLARQLRVLERQVEIKYGLPLLAQTSSRISVTEFKLFTKTEKKDDEGTRKGGRKSRTGSSAVGGLDGASGGAEKGPRSGKVVTKDSAETDERGKQRGVAKEGLASSKGGRRDTDKSGSGKDASGGRRDTQETESSEGSETQEGARAGAGADAGSRDRTAKSDKGTSAQQTTKTTTTVKTTSGQTDSSEMITGETDESSPINTDQTDPTTAEVTFTETSSKKTKTTSSDKTPTDETLTSDKTTTAITSTEQTMGLSTSSDKATPLTSTDQTTTGLTSSGKTKSKTSTVITTSATDKTTSATDKTTSATDKTSSATDIKTSATDKTTSATDKTTSATDKTTSATDKTTSATDKTSSATDITISATDKTTTATDKTTTATDKTTTATDKTTTASDKTTTATDKTTTASDKTTTATDKTTTATDKTTTATDKTTTATDKTTSSAGKTTTATDKTTSSAGKTTTATDKTTSSAGKTTSTAGKTTSSADKTTSSADKTTSSAGKMTSSSDKTLNVTSMSEKTSSGKQTSISTEKETTSSSGKQTSTSTGKQTSTSSGKQTSTSSGKQSTTSSSKPRDIVKEIDTVEVKREKELRVIHQRTDSREERESSPSPMASLDSVEAAYEKLLVVERLPADEVRAMEARGRTGSQTKTPRLSVVTRDQFDDLVNRVLQIQRKFQESGHEMPENAKLMQLLREQSSLTDAKSVLQLSSRVEAVETELKQMVDLVANMANIGSQKLSVAKGTSKISKMKMGKSKMRQDVMGQSRMDQGGMGPGGMGPGGMGQSRMEQGGMGPDGMGPGGMGQSRMEQGGMGQDGMEEDGMGQGGMGQDGMEQDGMGQGGMGQDGMEQDGGMGQDKMVQVKPDKSIMGPGKTGGHGPKGPTTKGATDGSKTQKQDETAAFQPGTHSDGSIHHDYVTFPMLNQELNNLFSQVTTNANTILKKAIQNAYSTQKKVAELDEKINSVMEVNTRMEDLESFVSTYTTKINNLDSALSGQMTNYQEELAQMQQDLECGLDYMAETLASATGDTTAITELNSHFNSLQDSIDDATTVQNEMKETQAGFGLDLEDLRRMIETLRAIKSDRDEVVDALRDKVGISDLNGMVSLQHFDAVRGDLEKKIGQSYDKFNNQEITWQKILDDLIRVLNEKADTVQVETLRDGISFHLNNMNKKLNAMLEIVGEPKAAATTRNLFRDSACVSCGTPAYMGMEESVTVPALPAARTGAAGGEAKLPQDAGDHALCFLGFPIPHPPQPGDHVCHRWCGGSRGDTKDAQLTKGLTLTQLNRNTGSAMEAGTDGKMYKVESKFQPCPQCLDQTNITCGKDKVEIKLEGKDGQKSRSLITTPSGYSNYNCRALGSSQAPIFDTN